MSKHNLLIAPCDYKASKYAVTHWHYSKRMPAGKCVHLGVWENDQFIGVLIFGYGAGRTGSARYNLKQNEYIELLRVALDNHTIRTSKILSVAIKIIKKYNPNLRLIVSFSDMYQNHYGILYQATNWLYVGHQPFDNRNRQYIKNGRIYTSRTVLAILHKIGQPGTLESAIKHGFMPSEFKPKHKYLYPLDKKMRRQILPLSKPYPKPD